MKGCGVLLILDGWGIGPVNGGNALTQAKPRCYTELLRTFPHAVLHASGSAVGLPPKQHGNSEAGHMNIGAGRVVEQDAVRINRAIDDGRFSKNPALLHAVREVQKRQSKLHLLGLLTDDESGHAFPKHLSALLKLAWEHQLPTYLHLFTDGRDTPKYEAINLLRALERQLHPNQTIATVLGRFWMDRSKRWSRTEAAYNAFILGEGRTAATAEEAVLDAYKRNESDEFISPAVIGATAAARRASRIRSTDATIFFNLRSDRARQITKVFMQEKFETMNLGSFVRKRVLKRLCFIALTEFGPDLPKVITAFPSSTIPDTLPMLLRDVRQLYIAESEKFSHVTFFLNGGYPHPVDNEQRIMVPSSNVPSFDEKPQMETRTITDRIIHAIGKNEFDFVCANFAAADMVGHTGNLQAGVKAVQCIDENLARLREAVLAAQGWLLVTGDHGNIENMLDQKTGEINTEHSSNPVPLLLVTAQRTLHLKPSGTLADVAPTVLALMGIPKPAAMTGHSLLRI